MIAAPSGELVNAVLDLRQAMENYKAHGHGHFVWKAYVAMRTADRHLVEHPDFAPDVDRYREDVLAAIEEIACGMLDLGEVTSDGGRKQLLNALKWADKGVASSSAREKEQQIVDYLKMVFSMLRNHSDEKLGTFANPAWKEIKSFDAAYKLTAEEHGESKTHVRDIWEAFTSSQPGLVYQRDAESAIEKRKKEIAGRRKPRVRAGTHKPVKPIHWKR